MQITPVVIGLAAVRCIVALAACGSAAYNSAATTNPSASAFRHAITACGGGRGTVG